MCEVLEACHIFASSHTGNALNTAFAEGERNIGLRLLNGIMAAAPDQYVQMMRERNERDATAESRRRQATGPNPDRGDRNSAADYPDPDGDDDGDVDPNYVTPYDGEDSR